jgi:hypothetical protein
MLRLSKKERMTDWLGLRSARTALLRMRRAYGSGNITDLISAYERAPQDSRLLRVGLALLESVYPVGAFLRLASGLDRNIAEHGLHEGCRRSLRDLAIDWECDLPEDRREIVETHPVVFFGNHPSLLTPFLVAASVDRPDLHYFSTSYVCRLIPSFGRISHPMEVPLTRSWTEWRRGGWRRVLAYRLVSLLHDMPDAEETKAINLLSLQLGASHVRQGGSAMICPGGGGIHDHRWYSGIGSLVKDLQQAPGDRDVYLVPVREENCTNKRVYAHLMNGPVARLKESVLYRGPVRVTIANPIPLSGLASPSSTAEQIVELLRAHYNALLAESALVAR